MGHMWVAGTKPSVRVTRAPGSTRQQRPAVAAAQSGVGASPAQSMAQRSLQTGTPVLLKSKLIKADMQTGEPVRARLAGRAASATGGASVPGDAAEPAGVWKTTVVKAFRCAMRSSASPACFACVGRGFAPLSFCAAGLLCVCLQRQAPQARARRGGRAPIPSVM